MRTTVTLDADVEQLLREQMHERGVSFKRALNDAIRVGASHRRPPKVDYVTASVSLGRPTIDLDRALQLAAEDEDAELARRVLAGS